jgi:hypothetical protein
MGVELWANPGAIGNILGNEFGNLMGTCQEHIGNQGGKKRFLPLKKKKLHPS